MQQVFINFTNCKSSEWSEAQRTNAKMYGTVIDVPFPYVDPDASEIHLQLLARKCVEEILQYHPAAVLCQGEFTLSFLVIHMLMKQNITVVASCCEREIANCMRNGVSCKAVQLKFLRFREYEFPICEKFR